jgi:lysophospholipase L1-like esterase
MLLTSGLAPLAPQAQVIGTTTVSSSASQLKTFRFGKFKPRPGDRIAFFGDSLTKANIYPTILELHYRIMHPEMGLSFAQFGKDGDSSLGAQSRIDTELVPFNPTVVVVFFGINDNFYRSPWELPETQQGYTDFQANYTHLLDLLNQKLPNARLVLVTTTVIDPQVIPPNFGGYDQAGTNDVLSHFSEFIYQAGRARQLPVVDVFHPMLRAMQIGRAQNPPFVINADGVHPTTAGYYYLATAFLEQWGEKKTATLK